MIVVSGINATIQANVPDRLRGRVMSLYVTVFVGGAPLGGLLAGIIAELWGPSIAFAVSGALTTVVLLIVVLGFRSASRRGSLERGDPSSAT